MRLLRPLILTVGVVVAVGACSSPGKGTASSTTAVAKAATSTTSAAAGGGDASSTTAGPTDPSPTSTPAPGATTTAAPTSASTAIIGTYFGALGLDVTDADAGCIAGRLGEATLASLADANTEGSEPNKQAREDIFGALVTCEPASYVDAQVGAITSHTKATADQARCVVGAANDLIGSDPAILALAADEGATSRWPEAEKGRLRDAISVCVPAALADMILEG